MVSVSARICSALLMPFCTRASDRRSKSVLASLSTYM